MKQYIDMQLSRFVFTVSQAGVEPQPVASLATGLTRLSDTVLPTWSHAGRPALTALFARNGYKRSHRPFKHSGLLRDENESTGYT